MQPTSLSSFSKAHNLPKASVHKFLKNQGFDTSEGMTDEAVTAAMAHFRIAPATPTAPTATGGITASEGQAIEAEIVPRGFFQSSELQATDYREAQLPEGFDPAAMVRFFDGVAGQATDTSALVSVAQMAIQAADTAMQNKVSAQKNALAKAEQDQATLDRMLAEAKVKLQISAMESRILAERQSAATAATEAQFQELMGMGKPAAPPTTDA
jgi:hypothetical protein